jgi:hypothetical protein
MTQFRLDNLANSASIIWQISRADKVPLKESGATNKRIFDTLLNAFLTLSDLWEHPTIVTLKLGFMSSYLESLATRQFRT